jgi:hypothetical protein
MDNLKFEWNAVKNSINLGKHGVSFEEASSVFYDEAALLIDDPEHSQEEARFVLLGVSQKARVLVVCHCYRKAETVIRIISARRATRREMEVYVARGEK